MIKQLYDKEFLVNKRVVNKDLMPEAGMKGRDK